MFDLFFKAVDIGTFCLVRLICGRSICRIRLTFVPCPSGVKVMPVIMLRVTISSPFYLTERKALKICFGGVESFTALDFRHRSAGIKNAMIEHRINGTGFSQVEIFNLHPALCLKPKAGAKPAFATPTDRS